MSAEAEQKEWFGHPAGLTILFLTNMWEQFSYFGMRALLIFYMTKGLLMEQQYSSFVYGAYTAFAYFTPILGGAIADRWLGNRRSVIIGGSIMAAGHFMMAFEPLFYPALATIALGNGLFLPCLPSQISSLYKREDPRRSWAYNVYYFGVNFGGFLAPLICGALGEYYGWHYGFAAAGVGMLVGLMIFICGRKYLPATGGRREATQLPDERRQSLGSTFLLLLGFAIAVTVFRGSYEQVGNTVALWSDTGVDRSLGSFTIPMTWFQALNPLLVLVFTPLLLAYWRSRAARGKVTPPARKMAFGAAIVAVAYLLLAGLSWASPGTRIDWLWLALFFAILTYGELYILPTGLGLFATLAPVGLNASTIAFWFGATFAGSLFAGLVGTLWSTLPHATFFALLGAIALTGGAALRLLNGPATRYGYQPFSTSLISKSCA